MSFDSLVFRQVGDRLVFEMIQIGAVKVDDKYQVVDSISIPIRPQYYVKIHPRIRKMTQLGAEELADAPTFLDAMAQLTLGFIDEDNDATEYIRAAGCREWKN